MTDVQTYLGVQDKPAGRRTEPKMGIEITQLSKDGAYPQILPLPLLWSKVYLMLTTLMTLILPRVQKNKEIKKK